MAKLETNLEDILNFRAGTATLRLLQSWLALFCFEFVKSFSLLHHKTMTRSLLFLLVLSLCSKLHSQQVIVFEDQVNLVPEGIAIHPANGTIYISSIAQKKIVQIINNKTAVDLIQPEQDGFLEGLGM
ncbi:MAG TPA: hypothetical protein VF476_14580, partial [Chitinophagaceae bacterium]